MNKSVIDHIEYYLGRIQQGWNSTPEGKKMDPQIVECRGGQIDQTRAFCTVGLSRHKLAPNAINERPIQQELLMLVPEDFNGPTIPALLQQLASDVLKRHRAVLCGDVIERGNPIFRDKPFYGFVAAVPSVLPDGFAVYTNEDGNEIVFAWMIPVTKSEADFIRKNDWGKLEDIVVEKKIDLIDLERPAIL